MKPAALGVIAGVAVGAAVGAASRGPSLVEWPSKVRTAFPFVTGGIAGASVGIKVGSFASFVRAARGKGSGPVSSVAPVIVGAGLATAAAVGGTLAKEKVLAGLEEQSRVLDPYFAVSTGNPLTSGSPASLVTMAELGREGARFVGCVSTPDDIETVTGKKPIAEPVRVFVGVDAADTVEQRVGLAMAELRRTGAFDRANLIIQAPAGTGFANTTPIDVTEMLTLGDCASVAIGYGLLPSFLSLGKVGLGAQTQRLLLDAIREELVGRESRPRILLYGESLGARVQEAAVSAGPLDLDHYFVDAALWVGSPGGQKSDEFHALCAAESVTVDRPEMIAEVMRTPYPRVWFLEHDGDPVVRNRPNLLADRPFWLPVDGHRGRNVPEEMTWKPGITWATVLVDTLFATNVKPGDFQSKGHDYRADLGGVVTAAYALPADEATAARLETHLRQLEVERAERIDMTEDQVKSA